MATAMDSSQALSRFFSPILTQSETAPMVQNWVRLPTNPIIAAKMNPKRRTC